MKLNGEKAAKYALMTVAFSAVASLLLIAVFIFKEGLPFMFRVGLKDFLFASNWDPTAGKFGIYPMIVASLWVTFGAMLIGAPLGVAGAIFLNEFVPKPVMRIVKPTIELLAGIPSVVFGFLGVMVLAPWIRATLGGPGLSVLAASIILGIMVLPTVISISTDAIGAVPNSYREGALALGATRWHPVRTLTANIALEMANATGMAREALFATGVVLFVVIMILNGIALSAIKGRVRMK